MNSKLKNNVKVNTISVLTYKHGSVNTLVDNNLQKNNPLSARGIYLVNVDNGVVWGYDKNIYHSVDGSIIRK